MVVLIDRGCTVDRPICTFDVYEAADQHTFIHQSSLLEKLQQTTMAHMHYIELVATSAYARSRLRPVYALACMCESRQRERQLTFGL